MIVLLFIYVIGQIVGLGIIATNMQEITKSFDNGLSLAHILAMTFMIPSILLLLIVKWSTDLCRWLWKWIKKLHDVKVVKWKVN
jgi:hypothetical protein